MANIKSAQKRVVSNQKKAVVNKAAKSALKTEIKKGKLAIESGAADMDVTVKNTIKAVDKAAAKGLIAKNTAARRKSALMKKENAAKAATK
ncbi:MAG TPA: 30S ribosomal protein S20 [Oscillospiraceae bacterium]|nr:30S ribosomal protein S20 [Oscillospiraceae bacterium]HPK36254.1 30S ribosomal protein S20 [Oscillospiraceae bacterium]HPR75478.1 30S ribosomal protein S20 [Oscillospiraceae bacterium]